MAPAIHPVELVEILRHKNLTPAIIFLTSRRACDEALDAYQRSSVSLQKNRSDSISAFLKGLPNFFDDSCLGIK